MHNAFEHQHVLFLEQVVAKWLAWRPGGPSMLATVICEPPKSLSTWKRMP